MDKAVEIALKLCAGLAAAHAKGMLHRDLKPANIMVDSLGEVRIMDFGLAAISEDLRATQLSEGTPYYMAPEQLAGQKVSAQSDIYALALVFYLLATREQIVTVTVAAADTATGGGVGAAGTPVGGALAGAPFERSAGIGSGGVLLRAIAAANAVNFMLTSVVVY